MKIGIEAQRLFRKKKHGMEVVALEIIRQLQQIDKQNEYVVFVKADEDHCIAPSDNMAIKVLPGKTYADWEQWSLPRAARQAKVDLLHCMNNTAPLAPGVPLVLTLHDIIYLEKVSFSGTAYQNFGNLYRRFVVPRIVGKCRQIITVSEYEAERIRQHLKLPTGRVRAIHNAVNPVFQVYKEGTKTQEMAKKYQLPPEFILFFGNTAPKKNTKRTVEGYLQYAAAQANPLPLVITDFSPELMQQLLGSSGNQALAGLIHVKDYISFADLPYIYNLATAYLYPSLRESFGLPILEAMRCGTPVVTSNTSSMPEVAGGAALLVDPLQPTEIAQALGQLLSDPVLYAQKQKEGLERAGKFSWENAAKEVLEVYRQVGEGR
jgi:glycosyltransferase involved in cell wall biosynthesis